MIGLILPIVLATLLALARGGSLAGWSRQHVHWWPGTLLALAIQLALFNPPLNEQPWALAWGPWVWVASMLLVAAVLLRNGVARGATRHAWLLAALGVGLNILVVVANDGYMPLAPEASEVVDRSVGAEPGDHLSNVAPRSPETRLAWLGDGIAQPAWLPLANVVSLGDLILSGGGAWWAFQATASARRKGALPPVAPDSGVRVA
jgi:hypothetical protein